MATKRRRSNPRDIPPLKYRPSFPTLSVSPPPPPIAPNILPPLQADPFQFATQIEKESTSDKLDRLFQKLEELSVEVKKIKEHIEYDPYPLPDNSSSFWKSLSNL